ncbi:hypothetical protein HPB50_018277 [Hyalomma asiaticum]|uniref:Uncharacterized protein n=1 Tax=Hyalomma asiaticum TaxID=266040 RepID=A0ACB7SJ67_HYAAI|nr:hypothetical protein HPB50_018277 [Hyalomma asiaticum]
MIVCVSYSTSGTDASGAASGPHAPTSPDTHRTADISRPNTQVNVNGELYLVNAIHYTVHKHTVDSHEGDEPSKKKRRVELETMQRDPSGSSGSSPRGPFGRPTDLGGEQRESNPQNMASSQQGQQGPQDQRALENPADKNTRDATGNETNETSTAEGEARSESRTWIPDRLAEVWIAGKYTLTVALQRNLRKLDISEEILDAVKDLVIRIYCQVCGSEPPSQTESVMEAAARATFALIERRIKSTLEQLSMFKSLATPLQRSIKAVIKLCLAYVKKQVFGL